MVKLALYLKDSVYVSEDDLVMGGSMTSLQL